MSNHSCRRILALAMLAFAAVLMSACHRGGAKAELEQAANIPSGFDITVLSEKDNTFDYDGAPLTAEDLKSALRYRKDESLPVATVLLKRGEKQKIKNEHIIALARIAYQLGIKAYVDEKGEISEIRAQAAQAKEGGDAAKPAKGKE